ncbi:hypothetical protein Vafri_9089 [Volvox africanus]|uniref:MIF4G domain-containing protein n=1 Tax=Volvox africanus TaxID=51714 RepID=A0A8J4B8A8_9CHLO|nr:hypothetical protein Vafri_9089 [Volvox africanus]
MAPSCGPSTQITDEASQQAAVAACLERLRRATGHFQAKRLAFEIRDVGFTPAGTLGTLQILVRWIFERAIRNPDRYAAPCAALCFSLTPILPTFKPPGVLTAAAKAKRIDFRQTLLNLCQQKFEEACSTAFSEGLEFSPPAAAAGPDGNGEGMGDEAVAVTPAASLHGSLQFLAHLYLHHLLTDRIMLSCLVAVSFREGAAGSSSGSSRNGGGDGGGSDHHGGGGALLRGRGVSLRVECLVRALLIAGRQLDECLAEQYRPQLDELYGQLAVWDKAHAASMSGLSVPDLSASLPLPPEVQTLLAQLLELRAGRWMNGGGASVAAAPGTASTANGFPGSRTGSGATTPSTAVAAAAATAAAKLGKGAGVITVHRSSGRLVMAAPVAASANSPSSAVGSPVDASPPTRLASTSATAAAAAGGGSVAGSSQSPAAAAAAAVTTALLRRQQLGYVASGSNGSLLLSRSSSHNQNLEGLWELSSETYNDVRGQLLSQPVGTSPATLEAMADEIVESAVAASGGDPSCPCWDENDDATEVRALTHGSMLGSAAAAGPTPPRTLLTNAEWSELMCQQWDEQVAACEIYVRLCIDALQQMSSATPAAANVVLMPVAPVGGPPGVELRISSPDATATAAKAALRASSCCDAAESAGAGGNGVAAAPAATDAAATAVIGDTGRAFRRALLSAAQTHFERCLAALLPVPASPSHVSDTLLLPSKQAAVPMSLETDSGGARVNGGGAASVASRRAWGDMPAVAPNASSALPRARGICHLLLGLLRKGILTPRIVLHCAAALVDGAASGSVACLQCACILLAGSGEQVRTFKMSEAAAFESLLKRLHGLAETEETAAGKLSNITADGSSPIATDSSSSNDRDGSSCGSSKLSEAELASPNQLLLRKRFTSWLKERLREKH